MKILLIFTFFAFFNPLLALSNNEKFDWRVGLFGLFDKSRN